jgi:hypothetical protein
MIDSLMDFMNTAVVQYAPFAIQYAIFVLLVYLIIQWIRSLSAAGRWKLVKLALTILFLPFVLVWKFTTAGSDCGCCCDEDEMIQITRSNRDGSGRHFCLTGKS